MDDLLKEAIADAKAVRETALENAKVALEEAFTPRLKSMLSKKIQSEIEEEGTEDEVTEDSESDKDADSVDESDEEIQDEGMYEDDEDLSDEDSEEEAGEEEEEAPEEEMPEDGMEEEGVIEINGVMYAPVVSEEGEEEEEGEEGEEGPPPEDEDPDEDLDLEAVLRELEAELEEDEGDDFTEETETDESDSVEESDEVDEEEEPVEEEWDKSSGVGKGDNKVDQADSSKIGVPGKAKHESVEKTEEVIAESDEEEIDLEEVLRALQEEDEVDTTSEDMENLQTELDEHRDVVKYLRSKLNEVNLLNAKLLFTNKLFRSYGLSNDQKMKVVETFDRAKNLREVKLVYATMAESFVNGSIREEIVKESKKGSASKPVASTKSEKQEQEIITESDVMKQRFKKLANIL